jgi:hypothetical protein
VLACENASMRSTLCSISWGKITIEIFARIRLGKLYHIR